MTEQIFHDFYDKLLHSLFICCVFCMGVMASVMLKIIPFPASFMDFVGVVGVLGIGGWWGGCLVFVWIVDMDKGMCLDIDNTEKMEIKR